MCVVGCCKVGLIDVDFYGDGDVCEWFWIVVVCDCVIDFVGLLLYVVGMVFDYCVDCWIYGIEMIEYCVCYFVCGYVVLLYVFCEFGCG